jgi:hypothetical protein
VTLSGTKTVGVKATIVRWAASLFAAQLLFGCGSGGTAAPLTRCQPLHAPEYPGTAGTIEQDGASGTWCVDVGQTVVVQLSVPPAQSDSAWSAVQSSNTDVLQPVPNGAATLLRGVTATFLEGMRPGVVDLTSTRQDGATWRATAVVGRSG